MAGFITDAVLVSAYDIHYRHLKPSTLSFATVIFLDSGGYEARVEHDQSEAYGEEYKPREWTQPMHLEVLRQWPKNTPRVIVTYDSPTRAVRLKEQIKRALSLQKEFPNELIEFLVKPESASAQKLPIQALIGVAADLRPFAAIGITEKESGSTFLERLENIARLRNALDRADVYSPIHVFGSLDAFTTPLYYLAGAEIFDGLTWLRFGYHEGATVYTWNYPALRERDWLRRQFRDLTSAMWKNNYYYLQELRDSMATFAKSQDYDVFGAIGPYLKHAAEALESPLRRRS